MKSISIYSYMDRFVIVPNQKTKSGFTFSSKEFIVSNENIDKIELWQLISEGLNQFKLLETEYDRNSASSKNFNKDLTKSVGAKSYTKFWQNSQFMSLAEKGDFIIIHALQRALNHKSWQGSFLPSEEFNKNEGETIAERILNIFKLMNE